MATSYNSNVVRYLQSYQLHVVQYEEITCTFNSSRSAGFPKSLFGKVEPQWILVDSPTNCTKAEGGWDGCKKYLDKTKCEDWNHCDSDEWALHIRDRVVGGAQNQGGKKQRNNLHRRCEMTAIHCVIKKKEKHVPSAKCKHSGARQTTRTLRLKI